MKELWKEVPGYEGYYKVSTHGRVISLNRTITYKNGLVVKYKGQLISQTFSKNGYKKINLNRNKGSKSIQVHKLMAITFLGHTRSDGFVVDHINNICTDNRIENLQLVTIRHNLSKDKKNKSSKYTGVSWRKDRNVWRATIYINGKYKSLGSFKDEYQAHLAYQAELEKI